MTLAEKKESTTIRLPTWQRLGFANPPDTQTSGKDIGIVILDSLRPHPAIRHLGHRIKYVTIQDDLSVQCINIAFAKPSPPTDDVGTHGLMVVLLLAHAPFELNNVIHVGISPAATFIVLNHGAFRAGEGERLKRGIAWLLNRREEWNIRLVLSMGWNVVPHGGWIEPTCHKPTVQGLATALEAGLTVVASNGNTRFENEFPPVEYLAIGGYNDHPLSSASRISPYPDEPWGRNGDGHLRPDLLAPLLYLPIPYCEIDTPPGTVSYFGQTSGAATLVTGICAHILAQYPQLDSPNLKQSLVALGDRIAGYSNPAPRVNAGRTLNALAAGDPILQSAAHPPALQIVDPDVSLRSSDPIERALALTFLARQGRCSRDRLWLFTTDESPRVRMVAVWALQQPLNQAERSAFWDRLQDEAEGGVRGNWAYGLLQDAPHEELDRWMSWIDDDNWTVRWCVSAFLQCYPEFPKLEMSFDPDLIAGKAQPVVDWYQERT